MFEKVKKFLNGKKKLEQPAVVADSSLKPEIKEQPKITEEQIEKIVLDKAILRYLIINAYYAYIEDGEVCFSKYSPLYYKEENSGIYLSISRNEASTSDVHYVQETFADYGIKSEILSSNAKKGLFISGATISKLDEKLQDFLFDIAPVVLRDGSRPYAIQKRCKEINSKLWAKPEFRNMVNGGAER